MTQQPQWIPVESNSSAPLVKWNQREPGSRLAGVYLGAREGRYGLLGDLETAEGPLTVPMPASLERQLARVKVGSSIVIEYRGLQHSPKTSKDYHDFMVYVTDAANLIPKARKSDDDRAPW